MENPASWTILERIIDKAIRQHDEGLAEGMCGYSRVAQIANALKLAGMIKDDTPYQGWTLHGVLIHCPTCHRGLPAEEYVSEMLKVIKSHRCKGTT